MFNELWVGCLFVMGTFLFMTGTVKFRCGFTSRFGRRLTLKQFVHFRDKFLWIERFCKEIVGA